MRLPTLSLAASLAAAAPAAQSQCVVTPGEDGEVSTWLLRAGAAGTIPSRPSLRASLTRRMDAPTNPEPARQDLLSDASGWRPGASAGSSLDVAQLLRRRGPGVVYAGLALRAAREGRRWLSLGTDDAVTVWLDGEPVFRRIAARSSRADDDLIALDLTAGAHRLVLKVVSRGDFDVLARIVGGDHRPDPSLRLELPGVDDAACSTLGDQALRVSPRVDVVAEGLRATLALRWPGGVAHPLAQESLAFEVSGAASLTSSIPLRGASVADLDATVAIPDEGGALRVRVGGATQRVEVSPRPAAVRVLRRAQAELSAIDPAFGVEPPPFPRPAPRPPATLPLGSLWSIERAAERLGELVSTRDRDAAFVDAEARDLTELLDALREGRDPYRGRQGALRRAYRSPLDGSLQEYSVYVPPSYRGDRPFPVVVGLHGLHGSAHRMLPILLGLYDESESRSHADRHLPPLPDTAAILVAPFGFGDAGYRQQGEHDVVRVVEEVATHYQTDPRRTYMTGLSMGGIGAAGVPFHHPDLFAASAALCGYHSYFVRGDTRGTRRPWETYLMELRSNDRVAVNGLHLPMYIVQGTLDRPLSHSQVLADRYQALGYSLQSEWPTLGHNVWSTTYADGRIVPWFLTHRRDEAPASVRFRTYELRWNRSAWVTLDALSWTDGAGAEVPVRAGRGGEVRIAVDRRGVATGTTEGVYALTLSPPASLVAEGQRELPATLDGDRLTLTVGRDNHLVRRSGRWTASERRVSLPAGGPVREVFDTPMVFVTGTLDPAMTRVHERVAQSWARRHGVPLRYPVVTDAALTDAMTAGRTLVLVGTPRTNAALARLADRLPIRFEGDDILVGGQRHRGDDLGVVFATAHPDHPERALLVIAGNSARALYRSASLPDLVPAWVVFDEALAPARGRILLGAEAEVRAAGFFDAAGRPLAAGPAPARAAPPAED
ncbi:MAG: alpha/beta hydrolase-fold protein [Polyangiales bacterium]